MLFSTPEWLWQKFSQTLRCIAAHCREVKRVKCRPLHQLESSRCSHLAKLAVKTSD